ncbi:DUF1449 family protein (plasmid) [Thioclava litoralis]|uniref:DUF1449 family protein n=1 Tax=Thioclava litoralis TaxID=3076557 RepID=A0ABZ1E3A1_9RHOB|nr:DUF1449 family protein [Thioclava sp. FTW29]
MTLLYDPGLTPFLIAAGLVVALLLLEVVMLLTGLSTTGDSGDLALDMEADADLIGLSAPEIAAELDLPTEVAVQIEGAFDGHSPAALEATPSAGGIMTDMLGLNKLPLTIWLTLFCALFAGLGLAVQTGLWQIVGQAMPRLLAVPVIAVPALALTRGLSSVIAHLLPRDETSAISERSLGRRRGVVTVGEARRGSPAQVRVTDSFGNTHYAMLEPLSESDVIAQGTEVLVLKLPGGDLRLVPIA